MLKRLAAAAALAGLCTPVMAGEAAEILRKHLYEGRLAAGLEQLAPLQAGDQEARFGAGLLTFVQGVEHLAQALYRHGLAAPETGPMGPPLLLPVPVNPSPEPLDYQMVRDILHTFVSDMDAARTLLEQAGEAGDYVVQLDLLRFRVDIDGDGVSAENESVGSVIANAFGADAAAFAPEPMQLPERERDGPGSKTGRPATAPEPPTEAPPLPEAIVGFDRADAIWLAGYSQVFAAQMDFLLAHDFEDTVNVSFHRLFPRAGLPMQEFSSGGSLVLDPETDNVIADLIATIHTVDWPVVEPDRLRRVLSRFQSVTALSRRNWEAILAETDDELELVPSPRQTAIVPDGKVTDEVVATWMATLDTADDILAGELLVPHWRFKQGFDLKAYFETATRTDFVMLLTGYAAVPYIKEGPVASAESFAAANKVFGDEFLGYVFWFN